ncbi:MAG: S-adenosylmethionine transporter [Chaenotheca gracillima]|nr:MAG: S-adenosylmethionine transporter [Chaenotheca gracillima]
MERKARQRISYVLPLADSPNGHRLGVNGLAVDSDRSILYSAGRDGVICAWSLDLDLKNSSTDSFPLPDSGSTDSPPKKAPASRWTSQIQAHTHWVNDIVLTQSNSALVSASSDLSVKVWRPNAEDPSTPQTLGLHSDYVKCLATPSRSSAWVASGGLDRKVCLWDLNGGGKTLQIDVGEDDDNAKGSVYALSTQGGVIASGGPENIVRLWDPRNGKRITKFVGHTGNIRDILINEDGDTIMTASSDQTVKVWSVTAGRCMHTLTMHNDSVWSLYSDHPQLSVFYSSDRSGLVAKTDTRGSAEMDDGLSVAVCQEHEGVNKVVSRGGFVWTATSNSSINRWHDVDTEAEIQIPASQRQQRFSISTMRSKQASPPRKAEQPLTNGFSRPQIPLNCVLRLSNTSAFPERTVRDPESGTIYSSTSNRKPSEAQMEPELDVIVPFHSLPEESIEGHNGLIQHILLNDKRRVLTLDTAGEIVLWDLLKCAPVQTFGKRHLEDVVPELNTSTSSISNWCTVDTKTGQLACVLEENHCFDAEIYMDELELEESIDFRDDQRINLGKWVLRYLFSNLIDEEIQRDSDHRKTLDVEGRSGIQRGNAPPTIQLPPHDFANSQDGGITGHNASTPRATNGTLHPTTPGLAISIATPAVHSTHQNNHADTHLPPTLEEGSDLEKRASHQSQTRTSTDKVIDYFSPTPNPPPTETPATVGNGNDSQGASETEKDNHGKEGGSLFGRKFKMSFGSKKLGRSPSMDTNKPAVVDEKSEDSDGTKSVGESEQPVEDNLFGIVQKIRQEYEQHLRDNPDRPLQVGIAPSLPNETPVLKPPPGTAVIIQEDRPDSGGVADLYRGTVASLGGDADAIERTAPMWLGDLLLRNQVPAKELAKISFLLNPWQDELPVISSPDGNNRLNANRMLRAKKILAYVAERIEPQPEQPDPDALKPEEYLELYCQEQLVTPNMTLADLRLNLWRTGGDIMLYYKSNGKKKILGLNQSTTPQDSVNAEGSSAENGQAVLA